MVTYEPEYTYVRQTWCKEWLKEPTKRNIIFWKSMIFLKTGWFPQHRETSYIKKQPFVWGDVSFKKDGEKPTHHPTKISTKHPNGASQRRIPIIVETNVVESDVNGVVLSCRSTWHTSGSLSSQIWFCGPCETQVFRFAGCFFFQSDGFRWKKQTIPAKTEVLPEVHQAAFLLILVGWWVSPM